MPDRRLVLAAALLGGLLVPAPPAGAGKGFFLQQDFEPRDVGTTGGFTSWFRTRTDQFTYDGVRHSTVQGLRVWARGLADPEGSTVWFKKPGESAAAEIGAMAWSENGSAVYEVIVDSNDQSPPEVPAGLESVLKLYNGHLQVRDGSGATVLAALVGSFSFEEIDLVPSGRRSRLRRPDPPVDDAAEATVRLWRKGRTGSGTQGVALTARGLQEDGAYEVWLEGPGGELFQVGDMAATVDGLGHWALDGAVGDDLLDDLDFPGVETVRELRRRRIEVRRSGSTGYSLAGLLPR